MQSVLLCTSYLPPLNYFSLLLKSENVFIEQHEYFVKQSIRSRSEILSANGKLILSIPVEKNADKELISEKRICYKENWQIKHWRAITSAYKNSAYFEYFEDDFKPFYFEKHEFLLDYNTRLTQLILKIIRQQKELNLTTSYEKEFNGIDLRGNTEAKTIFPRYYQVFEEKFGFTPNLSVIDLLFNKGLESVDYLTLKI